MLELPKPHDDARFFLDEGLPPKIGQALWLVHFPIVTAAGVGIRGIKDAQLIPWLAENDLTWITKDDEARREHLDDIIKHSINTVWIRGIDRIRNKVSIQQVHLMLTVRLPRIMSIIEEARGPRHFMLHISGEHAVMNELRDLHGLRLKRLRRSRRGN